MERTRWARIFRSTRVRVFVFGVRLCNTQSALRSQWKWITTGLLLNNIIYDATHNRRRVCLANWSLRRNEARFPLFACVRFFRATVSFAVLREGSRIRYVQAKNQYFMWCSHKMFFGRLFRSHMRAYDATYADGDGIRSHEVGSHLLIVSLTFGRVFSSCVVCWPQLVVPFFWSLHSFSPI